MKTKFNFLVKCLLSTSILLNLVSVVCEAKSNTEKRISAHQILLKGAPEDNAINAVVDVDTKENSTHFVTMPSSHMMVSPSMLRITLSPSATVGEFNRLLTSIAARIAISLEKVSIMVIIFPPAESYKALAEIIEKLKKSSQVIKVSPVFKVDPAAI